MADRSTRRTSSQFYFDSYSTMEDDHTELESGEAFPTLERQNSVEYLDSLSFQDAGGDKKNSSTPDLTDTSGKKKKKRHLRGVFHRHKGKHNHSSPLDDRLGESLPASGLPLHSLSADTGHLSLHNSWSHSWNSLDPDKKNSSANSSNVSMESEEELIESLVHPQGPEASVASTVAQPEATGAMGYIVNITLLSGHGLAIRDRTGTSDPYVKFKCPPFKYRSAVIQRNLNPEWNEHFSFRTSNLKTSMLVRVYDHDYGSLDDYMGGQTLDLLPYANGEVHVVELGLVDPMIKNENLGYLRLYLKIVPTSESEGLESQQEHKKQKSSCPHIWKSILTVTLLGGSNLPPMDQNGLCDPYCKFKLGSQKFKSTTQSKTLDPQWRQRFDLRMYDDCSILHIEMWDKDFPQNDDFIGICCVDLTSLSRNVTHNFTLPLIDKESEVVNGGECTLHFNLCITGTRVEEEEETVEESKAITNKYGLLHSLDLKAIKERNVGHLTIKIDKVVDLVPCTSYVLMELGNSCVKTRPIPKCANPVWDQAFEFTVGDIHEELEIMVYKIGSRNNEQLLGQIKIPLHRLREGCQQFALKDKQCLLRSRGVLHIETELVYNPVRAMIRTVNPREGKIIEDELGFKKKVLMDNIKRVTNLVRTIMATVEFINSTWSWESKPLSAISFIMFLIITYFGELWMLLFACAVIFLYQYLAIFIRGDHVWQKRVSSTVHQVSSVNRATSLDNPSHDDSDFSDSMDDKHTSLREKLKLFHEILILVQKYLGYVADAQEGLRNLLNWRVPFLAWMVVLVCMAGTVLFYIVPIRYVVLVWGINKYTKRLRKPNFISNNEVLDFLCRCPTNRQLQQWQELPLAVYHKPAQKRSAKPAKPEKKMPAKKTK